MTSNDHVMDTPTVKIGRDVGGHKAKKQWRQLKHAQWMKIQKEKNEPIDVYSGSMYVAEMPLHLLTRFSKVAAGAFPRSKNDPDISATTTIDKETESLGKRKLILDHESGVEPPTNASVLICLDYMNNNKSVGRDQSLQAFHTPAEASILTLLNVYAAVLALDLRPFPRTLEKLLCNHVTVNKPTAEVLEYFYQRLPQGKLLTRTLTSIVEKQIDGQYSVEEDTALTDLIDSDDYLTRRMNGIRSSRIRQSCNADHAAKMKMGWDSVEAKATSQGASLAHVSPARTHTAVHGNVKGHGGQKDEAGGKGHKTKSKKSKPKEPSATPDFATGPFEEARRRTEEADKTGNDKGVNCKHVPGA
ncbi:hypothetical protein KC363_g5769 [Hortaea werneckii]|nr:hypothetical protein KC325_g6072 [Hortaea werneckii]KAI6990765.1 hypothetical protein KC359_g6517 [Hortaea werneckii]KAI7146501.1 hypothetical protein KC344_g3585 [Hortaea werneckii]KAI7171650.1 hypothetical protein KC360_g6018 [Hortaea werneckii]KAI7187866.1 hypothetical protein KC363_g5769 [Hortaea werneckii]